MKFKYIVLKIELMFVQPLKKKQFHFLTIHVGSGKLPILSVYFSIFNLYYAIIISIILSIIPMTLRLHVNNVLHLTLNL